MWNDFTFSLGATLPVFAVMALGFLLRRRGFLTEGFCKSGNKLVFRLCLPAMLLRQIAAMRAEHLLDLRFLVYATGVSLLSALVFWVLARLLLKDRTMTGAFVQGSFRGNTALLGTVLLQSICGSQAYAPLIILAAVPVYNVLSVIILSLEAGGGGHLDKKSLLNALKGVAKNPIIWGVLLGLPFALSGTAIPPMADKVLACCTTSRNSLYSSFFKDTEAAKGTANSAAIFTARASAKKESNSSGFSIREIPIKANMSVSDKIRFPSTWYEQASTTFQILKQSAGMLN